jgi:hypothetical protein
MTKCLTGVDPDAGAAEGERFWIMRMYETTIYGHTIDRHTRRHYPEDWPLTANARTRGWEFACWHSTDSPEGEIGSAPTDALQPITYEQFSNAATIGWPHLQDEPVTTEQAKQAFGYLDRNGDLVITWDSLRGNIDSSATD